jgi:hypothetical protein
MRRASPLLALVPGPWAFSAVHSTEYNRHMTDDSPSVWSSSWDAWSLGVIVAQTSIAIPPFRSKLLSHVRNFLTVAHYSPVALFFVAVPDTGQLCIKFDRKPPLSSQPDTLCLSLLPLLAAVASTHLPLFPRSRAHAQLAPVVFLTIASAMHTC